MKLIVLSMIAPPHQVLGYARRFLMDFGPGLFIGSGTRDLAEDIRGLLESSCVEGFLLLANARCEAGFEVLYFHVRDRRLIDMDGWFLLERPTNISRDSHDVSTL